MPARRRVSSRGPQAPYPAPRRARAEPLPVEAPQASPHLARSTAAVASVGGADCVRTSPILSRRGRRPPFVRPDVSAHALARAGGRYYHLRHLRHHLRQPRAVARTPSTVRSFALSPFGAPAGAHQEAWFPEESNLSSTIYCHIDYILSIDRSKLGYKQRTSIVSSIWRFRCLEHSRTYS